MKCHKRRQHRVVFIFGRTTVIRNIRFICQLKYFCRLGCLFVLLSLAEGSYFFTIPLHATQNIIDVFDAFIFLYQSGEPQNIASWSSATVCLRTKNKEVEKRTSHVSDQVSFMTFIASRAIYDINDK